MYIINNIDRPLGIYTYGVLKKYLNSDYNLSTVTLRGDTYYDAAGNRVGNTNGLFDVAARYLRNKYGQSLVSKANEAMKKKWTYANGLWLSDTVRKLAAYNAQRRQDEQQKPLIFKPQDITTTTPWFNSEQPNPTINQTNTAERRTGGDKPQIFPLYNPTTKKTTYYNSTDARDVAKKEILNLLKGGNKGGVPQRPTGGGTSQRSQRLRLDPNRFVSIYDTTGLWKLHAQDNNLTDRDSVRRFLKEILGFDDTLADGIWGRNTEAAYSRWKANKDAATLQLNSPVKLITVSNTPISRWDTNENLKGRFNNYASMLNYVNSNPEDSFSKAMTTRFGNTNTWNLQDIEKALDVAGTYRGSDRKDIANSFNNYYLQQLKTDNNIKNIINNTNQTMNNWRNFTSNLGILKNEGLISRNPITRFKLGGMLRKLLNGYKIVGTDDQGLPIYLAVDSNVLALIEALAAKEVLDFLNSLRASKQLLEQEFSPVEAINTWKNIIPIPKKEVTIKSLKRSSKNNSNKKNKGSLSQKKITVTTYAKDPNLFPVDPMPPISKYEEASQWGGIRTPIVPQQQTYPYSSRLQGLRPNRYGLGDDYYKRTMGFVAP